MCSFPRKIGCTHDCGIKNTPKTMHFERVCIIPKNTKSHYK